MPACAPCVSCRFTPFDWRHFRVKLHHVSPHHIRPVCDVDLFDYFTTFVDSSSYTSVICFFFLGEVDAV